jgi:O-antigen ligase
MRLAVAPGEAVEPVVTMLLAAIAGISAVGMRGRDEVFARLLAALVALTGARALYEAIWGLHAWAERVRESAPATGDALAALSRLEQGRPYGGFATPAALGCFLIMTIPPVAAWAYGQRGALRALALGAAALGTTGLAATRSLSALGALGCALALAALRGRVAPRALAAAAATIGLVILGAGLLRPDAVFSPTRADSPWKLRAGNVRVAMEIARDHPLAGVGPGGYAETFPQYRRDGDNESRHAHDLPAELAAEWGLPVGLALSALFFFVFVGPVVRGGELRPFDSGLAVGLAAFAVHNLADFTAFLPSLLVAAAILRGLLVATVPTEDARPTMRAVWLALAFVVAVVAAGSGLARDALFDARAAAAGGDHATALRLARRAEALAGWDANPPQFSASALMAGGTGAAAALEEADRAVARAPSRAAARAVRARARAAAGDSAGAYADLAEAARLYPLNADYPKQRDALADALRSAAEAAPR